MWLREPQPTLRNANVASRASATVSGVFREPQYGTSATVENWELRIVASRTSATVSGVFREPQCSTSATEGIRNHGFENLSHRKELGIRLGFLYFILIMSSVYFVEVVYVVWEFD
jgi:hypothetical protein